MSLDEWFEKVGWESNQKVSDSLVTDFKNGNQAG